MSDEALRQSFLERVASFWEKVDKRGEDDCWEWKGARGARGYGSFSIDSSRSARAHRVVAAMSGADIDGAQVNHECDNRACVNPGHLYIGDHRKNMQDMILRGRHGTAAGEDNGKAVLTEDDVRAIRASDEDYPTLAEKYNTSPQNIGSIVRGETWQGVEPEEGSA